MQLNIEHVVISQQKMDFSEKLKIVQNCIEVNK